MNTNQVKETLDKYVMHTYGRYDLVLDHGHGSIVYDKMCIRDSNYILL